jgi:hypothetical protein
LKKSNESLAGIMEKPAFAMIPFEFLNEASLNKRTAFEDKVESTE